MTTSPPLIIGATGGSGTRVVARIVQRAGYNLGSYLNEASDALAFRPFHDRWINPFLDQQKRNPNFVGQGSALMPNHFQLAVAKHLSSSSEQVERWGWKAPRSIYLLPFFHHQFAGLKFIHVLRDGRDMAFSPNQNQLGKHGMNVLSRRERWFNSQPIQSILLWSRINLHAAEFGQSKLGQNYLAVRFEDLCSAPVETIARISKFLGTELDSIALAQEEVAAPSSLGRWRKQPSRIVSKLTAAAEPALRKFGYL